MLINFTKCRWSEDSEGLWLSLCVEREFAAAVHNFIDSFRGKRSVAEIKQWRKRRSLDANALCWAICTAIAEKTGASKDEVYRQNIREGNEFTPLPILESAVDDFCRLWGAHGVGWFAEIVDDSKLAGYKLVHAYHGSSTYDTAQMHALLDRLVQDARACGIEVMSESERALIMADWGKHAQKNTRT